MGFNSGFKGLKPKTARASQALIIPRYYLERAAEFMTRIYKYKMFRKYKHHNFYHILSKYYGINNDSSNYVPEIANRWWVPCHKITHSVIRY